MPNNAAPDPSEFYKKCFEIENNLTRNILKAIPPGKLDYRPHERSRSTGQIVLDDRSRTLCACRYGFAVLQPRNWYPHPAMAEILGRFEDTTRRHIA